MIKYVDNKIIIYNINGNCRSKSIRIKHFETKQIVMEVAIKVSLLLLRRSSNECNISRLPFPGNKEQENLNKKRNEYNPLRLKRERPFDIDNYIHIK